MYEELIDMLSAEIRKIQGKKDMTAGDLETLYKLTETVKNLYRIAECEGDEGRYSNRSEHYVRGHYSRAGGRYSRSSDTVHELERMMDEARTEREREAIRHCLEVMS